MHPRRFKTFFHENDFFDPCDPYVTLTVDKDQQIHCAWPAVIVLRFHKHWPICLWAKFFWSVCWQKKKKNARETGHSCFERLLRTRDRRSADNWYIAVDHWTLIDYLEPRTVDIVSEADASTSVSWSCYVILLNYWIFREIGLLTPVTSNDLISFLMYFFFVGDSSLFKYMNHGTMLRNLFDRPLWPLHDLERCQRSSFILCVASGHCAKVSLKLAELHMSFVLLTCWQNKKKPQEKQLYKNAWKTG